MNFYDFLFAAFDAILSYITVSYLFSAFSKNGRIKWNFLHVIAILSSFFVTAFVENAFITIILSAVFYFVISLEYKFKWYASVFLSFMAVAVSVLSEMLVGLFMMTVFSMNFAETLLGVPYFIGLILSRFLSYVIAFILKTLRHRIFYHKFEGKWLLIFSLPIASVVISLALLSFLGGNSKSTEAFALWGIILLIISNVLIFFFLDSMHRDIINREKLAFSDELIKKQEERYQELCENNLEIKRLRHDHKNFLLGVLAELEEGKTEELKAHLKSELELKKDAEINSGNSVLDIVISSKMNVAKKYDISFETGFYRMSQVKIPNTDLAVLVGNALDNAIEGAKKVEGKKVIRISISLGDGQIIFSITNPTEKKIDVSELTTTKDDKENHGFGILSIKSIAERYQGDAVFLSTDNTFKTVVCLKNTE